MNERPSAAVTRAATAVDIAALIDDAPLKGLSVRIACVAFVLMITDGLDLQAMAFAAPGVIASWSIHREALGPVLAASVAGMGVGSILLAWFGDRAGRKLALSGCIGLLGLGSLGSALSGSLAQLVLFRLITGIGLGGAAPIAATLGSEWVPARWRTIVVVGIIVGVPLGGMLGAEWSAAIVPGYGWRSVFWTGVVLAGIFLTVAGLYLPESPKFLVVQRFSGERVATVLNRLFGAKQFSGSEHFEISDDSRNERGKLWSVLSPAYLSTTLLLCLVFAFNSLTLYGLVNWLPTVLSASGFPLEDALRGSVWFNLGGVAGAILGSWLARAYGSRYVGTAIGLIGAVAILSAGMVLELHDRRSANATLLLETFAASGACINALQTLLYAVSAHSYPTALRSTGTGFASAAARIGGVLSSVVGAALFALGLEPARLFSALAVVTLVAAALFFCLRAQIPSYSQRAR